ncbi:hypothetical protein LBMAG27_07620 [Bacteroidota bacterium]|nr:hypothetical protein LBMAG27_07620 [Bacteroidota bacterium]
MFEKNISIVKSSWKNSDKIKLEVDIQDTSATYNVYINVRHSTIYPYSNLWVMVTTTSPGGNSQKQRVEIPLADEEGAWHGEGMGDVWDLKYLAQQNAIFNQKGKYSLEFEQIMRQDPLDGIMAMGLRVEQTTPIN